MSSLKGKSRWSRGIDSENNSRQCRGHECAEDISQGQRGKDRRENENRVCWSKNRTASLCDVNSKAAVLRALPYRVVTSNSLFNVSSVRPATWSVITRRKHLTQYENPGSGKKASIIIQPGSSWWSVHARAGRALYLESMLSSLVCYVTENVLPNCAFTSGAQELTRISNFWWIISFSIHRGNI